MAQLRMLAPNFDLHFHYIFMHLQEKFCNDSEFPLQICLDSHEPVMKLLLLVMLLPSPRFCDISEMEYCQK